MQVRKTRELHRDARQRDGRCLVALVGYTNAGKSSLMNALSGSNLDVENRRGLSPLRLFVAHRNFQCDELCLHVQHFPQTVLFAGLTSALEMAVANQFVGKASE